MDIPTSAQTLAIVITVAAIGTVAFLIVLVAQLLRGRIRAAVRTTVVIVVLVAIGVGCAIPLGTPATHLVNG